MLAAQKQRLVALFHTAAAPLVAGTSLCPNITLERPRDPAHGDIACNLAMQLAKPLKKNPREVAQSLVDALLAQPASRELVESAHIAGPGFINLRITPAASQEVVRVIFQQGKDYGCSTHGAGKKVMLEFVSANPTGPLHVGHGRQGVLGDVLASLFQIQGYAVTREFYYNDAGVQIATLAASVQARAKGIQPGTPNWPDAAYNGDYIQDIANDFLAQKTVAASDGDAITASGKVDDIDAIRRFAVAWLRREQDYDLQTFGIRFDHYFLESSLYTDGKVEQTVDALIAAGKTYEEDGALWLRTTDWRDDKNRVMKKSDGTYTYFVPDVAYHTVKWQRGFSQAINIQGSDHHGTIARVRAGLQALDIGIPEGYPDYVLHKMVTVMRGGAEVKISKRAGSYITLRDLIEWSGGNEQEDKQNRLVRGRDVVRFFLVSRKADTEFVFDIDLALAQSEENPVYYVQYAHARICSVFAQWAGNEADLRDVDLSPLAAPRESLLLALLAEYPDMLHKAGEELAPHQVAFYLRDLAGQLHGYYNAQRILVDDMACKLARLALLYATRQVLQNGLALLGVSAPEHM